ncbi:hypothetical protein ES703_116090 [subsurface metagenome]
MEIELANIQAAVKAMMVENDLTILAEGDYAITSTNDMTKFPSRRAVDNKYILYGCNVSGKIVNYVATKKTEYWYVCDAYGGVTQHITAP